MKIRNQIIIAIVPLFMGLSAVTGALTYYLQARELSWGLNEEATSIAVAAARLIDENAFNRLSTGTNVTDAAALREPLQRVIRWKRASRITLLSGRNQRVLLDVSTSTLPRPPVEIPPAMLPVLDTQPVATGSLHKDEAGVEVLTAYAPIRSAAGILLGFLAVETDANTLLFQRSEILRSVLIPLAASTLLGLLLAIAVSTVITHRLGKLTSAVLRAETATDGTGSGTGVIDEINDLSNTFDTMKSVLGEVVSKTQRALIEAEQFRTDEDLLPAYQRLFQSPAQKTIHGMNVAGRSIGDLTNGSFFASWAQPEGGFAIAGRIQEIDTVEQTALSSGALAYLEESMKIRGVPASLAAMAQLFPMIQGSGATWGPDGKNIARWTLDNAGQWHQNPSDRSQETILLLHTLDDESARRLHVYVHQFRHLPLTTLLDEIPAIMDGKAGGAVVMVQPAAATPVPS